MRYLPLLVLAATAHLGAQNNCHYTWGNFPNSGVCGVIPWGTTRSSSTWRNVYYQTKMTAKELGNSKRTITSLSFAPCGTGTHSSASLVIKMAHHKGALTLNFAANLGNSPVTVLNKKGHTWAQTASVWSKIGLTGSFNYDPAKGDLLVEILVMGNHSSLGNASCRHGGRPSIYAINWWGIPPASGMMGSLSALKMRVCDGLFGNYGKGCGGGPLNIAGSGAPNLGKRFGLNMAGGRANSGGSIMLGATQKNLDLSAIGMTGCSLYLDPIFSKGVPFGPKGVSAILNFVVPNNPYFVGKTIYGQGVNIDLGSNRLGLTSSGGTAITFGK